MSFIGVAEQDLSDIGNAVVDGLKDALNYVDNFSTTDLVPDLTQALLAAIKVLGQDAVAALLGTAAAPPSATPPST